MSMLSEGVLKMLEQVNADAGFDAKPASKAAAAAELGRRLHEEGARHSCLRCEEALWCVEWVRTPNAPVAVDGDYQHKLLACRSHAVIPADETGAGLAARPVPFFCSGESSVARRREQQNDL